MDDLIAFLRARLAEDERTARAVEDRSAPWDGQWMADGNSAVRTLNGHVLFYRHGAAPLKPGLTEHIARHDPARVLREVAAKRELLDEHQDVNDGLCGTCVNSDWGYPTHGGSSPQNFPCRTLRLLALPYADHPEYREEWRP